MTYIKFEVSEEVAKKTYEVLQLAKTSGNIRKGVNEVTKSIERGLATFVVIAADVTPEVAVRKEALRFAGAFLVSAGKYHRGWVALAKVGRERGAGERHHGGVCFWKRFFKYGAWGQVCSVFNALGGRNDYRVFRTGRADFGPKTPQMLGGDNRDPEIRLEWRRQRVVEKL